MPFQSRARRYATVPQLLHWTVVILLVAQFLLAEAAEDLPTGIEKLVVLSRHKSLGLTILVLAALRVAWRLAERPPPLPPMPAWQRRVATTTHWGLYGLLFALPLSGWTMSSAANYPVSWFGLLPLPALVAPSESLQEVLHAVHEALATGLLWLAGLHLLAVLKHQFVDRDGLLFRMLPWPRRR